MSPSDASSGGLRSSFGLGFDLFHRLMMAGAADRDRARAVGAHAELHLVGVAMHDLHLADRNAERSAISCAKVVSWPWPWLCEPVRISMVPTGLTRTPRIPTGRRRRPGYRRLSTAPMPQASM